MRSHRSLPLLSRARLFQHLAGMEKAGVPTERAFALLDLGLAARGRVETFRRLFGRGVDPASAGANSGLFTMLEARLLRRGRARRVTMHLMKPFRTILPLAVALLLAGCAADSPVPVPQAAALADSAASWYRKAAQSGQDIYKIDAAQSLITITVRRGGALARLGHDHVVATRTLEGFVAPDAGRADFHFRLDQMTVDEPALRAQTGLDTQPSGDAIAGTRANMLNRVLDADRFPVVMLHAETKRGAAGTLRLTVTLHGVARSFDVPTTIERDKTTLTASGELRMLQSEFGITPMSVMGGAMTVQDPMELKFRVVAKSAAGTR